MQLGERIYRLRTERNMSQGELADQLEVSRQSVSKWENGSAVPELDKLLKLSEIFGISLDALVRGQTCASPEPETVRTVYVERPPERHGQKTAGMLLLCLGALVWLLITVMGDLVVGLFLASPFLLCGLICMTVRVHAGLWCGWTVYALAEIYLRVATGVNWKFAINPRFYYPEWHVQLLVSWVTLIVLLALIAATVLCFGKKPMELSGGKRILLLCGWGVFVLLFLPMPFVVTVRISALLSAVIAWIQVGLMTVLLVFTLRYLKAVWKKKHSPQT